MGYLGANPIVKVAIFNIIVALERPGVTTMTLVKSIGSTASTASREGRELKIIKLIKSKYFFFFRSAP